MVYSLVQHFLRQLIRRGQLFIIVPGRPTMALGTAGTGPAATIRLHDKDLLLKLALSFTLTLGEGYMDGSITIEQGTLYDLLELFAMNYADSPPFPWERLAKPFMPLLQRLQQYNPLAKARANVAHHYDLSYDLYKLFLDADMQYSCAYFENPDDSLEAAQLAKKRHIASKLLLRPGMRVLDIGCGWGGMALYLAQTFDVEVVGLTLSREQYKIVTSRAEAAGLSHKVKFYLRDYRDEQGPYDRIVSVGMFEHVGVGHYGEFFAKVKSLLAADGVMLLHAIGRKDGPGETDAWMRKYIFPGGYAPALSEVLPKIEQQDFWVTDIEILRLHYAETLRHWRARFNARRDDVRALYDEKFCRMWEFYLIGAEVDFRYLSPFVFQIQLAKQHGPVPLTRTYIN